MTAAGFGAGSALTIVPISAFIKSKPAMRRPSCVRHRPGPDRVHAFVAAEECAASQEIAGPTMPSSKRARLRPEEVVRKPVFWVMYFMFVIVAPAA